MGLTDDEIDELKLRLFENPPTPADDFYYLADLICPIAYRHIRCSVYPTSEENFQKLQNMTEERLVKLQAEIDDIYFKISPDNNLNHENIPGSNIA